MGCIYLVTNRINGKQYVGKTGKSMNRRRAQHERDALKTHCMPICCAIVKHGPESFEWEEVYSNVPDEDLNRLEIECIAWYGTRGSGGYNITKGGNGVDSKTMKKAMARPGAKARKIEAQNRPEVRAKKSEAGKKNWTNPKYRANIIEASRKALNKPEVKARIGEASKKAWAKPEARVKRAATDAKPEVIARRTEALKKALNRPEVKAKRAATDARPEVRARRSESQNRPEVKARKIEALKRSWVRRRMKKFALMMLGA